MNTRLLKITNKVLSALISLLGIGSFFSMNSCATTVEYGVPHAKYKVNGNVFSETGEAISGIRVIMDYDTAQTNPAGYYEVIADDVPLDTMTFNLKFTDTDGEKNGQYFDKDTSVTFLNPEFNNGDDNWYHGEASKELNIKLDKHE